MKKVVIIIQARMSSTRLPGKSLMEMLGKPLLWHVVERAKKSKVVNKIIVATTNEKEDSMIADFFENSEILVFRGDLNDVLDRYYQAAKKVNADIIVRITGDSPLIDPFLVDEAIKIFKEGNYDYVSNGLPPWMDGFDVEVFSFKALEYAWNNAIMASEREHVTPYIKNSGKFKVYYMKNDPQLANIHASVDKKEDLEFVSEIYLFLVNQGKDHTFTYQDVISILKKHPELLEINKTSIINEGYFKSLKEDKKVK